jgi:hypothetical protein
MARRNFPVAFTWRRVDVVDKDGVVLNVMAMVPDPSYSRICERQYLEGEEYALAPLEARSRASHNAYFAEIDRGYDTLPEKITARWKSSEHFRKWALIETGWFDETEIEVESERHANRLMRRLMNYTRHEGHYVRVLTSGNKVFIRSARSQAAAAMGKTEFEASKRDVLDLLTSLIGISSGTLRREARRA